jgi:hypothetical protein
MLSMLSRDGDAGPPSAGLVTSGFKCCGVMVGSFKRRLLMIASSTGGLG